MGLDNYWECDREVEFNPPLKLCGGMFSGHGQGSFRGKVYFSVVLAVTGESLYQEHIDAATVKAMAERLQATDFEAMLQLTNPDPSDYQIDAEEFADLQRMFRVYADAGAELRAWA